MNILYDEYDFETHVKNKRVEKVAEAIYGIQKEWDGELCDDTRFEFLPVSLKEKYKKAAQKIINVLS